MGSKGKKRFKAPSGPVGRPQAQMEQVQSQMEQMQASLAAMVITGTAGGGAVSVEMTGDQELKSIKIKPEAVDPEDVEMLQDLIVAAFKEAQDKVRAKVNQTFGPLTGGLDLGGLM